MFLSLKKAKRLKPKTIVQAQAVLNLVGKKSLHGSGNGGKYWKLNNQVGVKVVGKTSNVVNELAMLKKIGSRRARIVPKALWPCQGPGGAQAMYGLAYGTHQRKTGIF
ncbi:MAG: hypothetical protein AB7V39_00600 [Nitrospiraceae bacterium]